MIPRALLVLLNSNYNIFMIRVKVKEVKTNLNFSNQIQFKNSLQKEETKMSKGSMLDAFNQSQYSQDTQLLTGYQCGVLVNTWLLEKGINHKIPTQMIYNYMDNYSKGKNPHIKWIPDGGKKRVMMKDLQEWFSR